MRTRFATFALLLLAAAPALAQDSTQAPPQDTAVTLPPEVRDSTAVSLPTEPPKDFADFLIKFLPFIVTMGVTFGAQLLKKLAPTIGNGAIYGAQFLVGLLLFILVRLVTGTLNAELWTLIIAALSSLFGLLITGNAFRAGLNQGRDGK